MNRMMTAAALCGLSFVALCTGGAFGQEVGQEAGQPEASAPVQIPASELPTAEEVFAAYVEALGGEEAVRAVTSRRFRGKVNVYISGQEGVAQAGRIEIAARAPATMVQDVVFPGQSSVRTIADGDAAWQLDDQDNATPLREETLSRQLASARFYQFADWEDMFSEVTVAGGVEQEGRRAVRLSVTHNSGRQELLVFDLDTGLLILVMGERPAPTGGEQMVAFRRTYEDYEETGGVKYARRVIEQAGNIAFEVLITEIETGIELPYFKRPAFVENAGDGGE